MTIEEQWQQDVTDYVVYAYLMYEISLADKEKYISAISNQDVEWALNSINYDVKRKESAELPFDLERAKAGDNVEFMSILPVEWIDVDTIEVSNRMDYGHIVTINGTTVVCHDETHLRMKYPPKVKVNL